MNENPEKMYTYLKGFAHGANMEETLKALSFAREKHLGQLRKSGSPYLTHPLVMACTGVSVGVREDLLISTILLHDVCEDCAVEVSELPVSANIRHSVDLLTFRIRDGESKAAAMQRYYEGIISNREATLTKLIDRCHNVSSMAGVFSIEKTQAYIEETRTYILPLLKEAKKKWPEDSDMLYVLKYHIVSVIDSIEAVMNMYDNGCRNQ